MLRRPISSILRPVRDRLVEKYSALLAVAEVGLGSLIHSIGLPFGGHLLSLNEGVILMMASKRARGRRHAVALASGISSVSAVLKGFSPAGKKLTPMLAICCQGLLYSLGIAALGVNLLGAVVGMCLLSLWGFLQPLLIAYLIFGKTLFEAALKVWRDLASALAIPVELGAWLLLGLVLLKLAIALVLAGLVWLGGDSLEESYENNVYSIRDRLPVARPMPARGPVVGAFHDLMTPWFLLSLALSVAFFLYGEHPAGTQIWIYVLRPLAIGWLFFWMVRALPLAWTSRFRSLLPYRESEAARP